MRRMLPVIPLALISLAFALGGCAVQAQYWYLAGATPGQFEAATAHCEEAAESRYPPVSLGRPGFFAAPNEWCQPTAGGTNCNIIGSGYLPQARSEADTNEVPRANAFNACMMAGGWRPTYPRPPA